MGKKMRKLLSLCLAVACVASGIATASSWTNVTTDVTADETVGDVTSVEGEEKVKVVNGKEYLIEQDGKIQMIQDPNFYTGINMLGVYPAVDDRNVKARLDYNGEALSSAKIDPWEMTQWYSPPSLADGYTHLTQGDYEYFKGTAAEKLVRVNRYKKELYMQLDTRYTTDNSSGFWPHILIEKTCTYKPTFGSIKSMTASLKFSIEDYENFTAPSGGKAAQVSWWFFITNGKADCWFGLPLFDSRQDIDNLGTYTGDGLGWEEYTLDATVTVARTRFAPHITKVKVGETYEISVNIKEFFQAGLDQLKVKYADFNESLDGFYVTGWNFGWEMPNGTYKAGVRVSDFSILVEEK